MSAPQISRGMMGGRLIADLKLPRVGIVGPPGMQAEVALTREGYHGVITLLGGSHMAAVGYPPELLRQHAEHCLEAARQIEARHGRGETGSAGEG